MKKSILLILLMALLSAPAYADEETDDCLDMAKNFYAAGDFGQAKEYLKLILAKNPTHYGANCLLIKMLPPDGFLNETTLDSKIIIRPACTNSGVKTSDKYNEQGRDCYKKSDYEKAKEAFLSAVKCNSKNRFAYNNLGLTYLKLNNKSKAESAFKKANQLHPTFTAPLDNYAQVLISDNDYVKAHKYLNQAIEKNKKDYCAYYLLGVLNKKEGKYQDALKALNSASQIAPDFALTYLQQADIYYSTKDYAWANSALDRYIELSPKDDYSYYMKYKNYIRLKDYNMAQTYIIKAIMMNNCIDYRIALASVETLLNNPKGAVDALKTIPNPSGEVLNEIGQNYLTLKDNEKALKAFQDASIKPYARPIYFYNIALVYKNMGDMENYDKLIKALDSMNPMITQDYVDLSGIYLDYAGKNKAIAILDKGLKLSPKNKQLLEAKIRIYNVTSDTDNENKVRQELNKVCK
mgnify:FL=1